MSDERSTNRRNRHPNIRLRSYKPLDDAWMVASTSDASYDSTNALSEPPLLLSLSQLGNYMNLDLDFLYLTSSLRSGWTNTNTRIS